MKVKQCAGVPVEHHPGAAAFRRPFEQVAAAAHFVGVEAASRVVGEAERFADSEIVLVAELVKQAEPGGLGVTPTEMQYCAVLAASIEPVTSPVIR